ncbi:unnamed protein product [Phaedon cochleariae]|uniref:Pre-rRNA-processing protein Ipi1 N-terminal domain-containing protein n=1 Tax=Phaedon cochleariae TaxID=80249 RepID=A0A9P0DMC0_PHACE|nr:unnamed protein product [Phaedon cochleariae]
MGKNHRHKKDLKADKAKVKLKQTKTKFLPKGLNVTNTSFKIKPIVLAEQLKEKDQNVPLSRRKLDVKDLLNRLKHYNENVRCTACEELSSMFKIHSDELIQQNLSEIILAVSTLMQDRESKVRKATVKAINTILESTPQEKLEPFFNYFSTNLRCAMTNISKNIQEDSLFFLDCFINNDCGLITKTAEKLLPDFFTLISKLRSDSNLNRTLTLNLGSKMTSVTWRIKVLNKLHAVLECILRKNIYENTRTAKMEVDHVAANSGNIFPIYKDSFSDVLECTDISCMVNSNNVGSTAYTLDKHIVTLVPLLYETWLEVLPEKRSTKTVTESTLLSEEAASILSCIMKTLHLLWKYSEQVKNDEEFMKEIFLSTDGKKFMTNLVKNFPYCQNDNVSAQQNKTKGKGLSLDINRDPKCVKENIMICYMFFILNGSIHSNTKPLEMEAIMAYINKCLQSRKIIRGTNIQYLIEFLKMCLLENSYLWKKAGSKIVSVLEHTISFYNSNMMSDKYKLELFKVLCGVADTIQLYGPDNKGNLPVSKTSFSGCPQYNDWLSSLPDLLCMPSISDTIVSSLLELSRKNNAVVHRALLSKLPNILENLDSLNVIVTLPTISNPEEMMKRNILFMYIYVPNISRACMQTLSNYISKHEKSQFMDYLLDELQKHCER